MLTSHRAQLERQRLIKRLLITVASAVGAVVFLLYVGLPILARLVLFTSSFKEGTSTTQNTKLILPPVLDPLPEATNSGRIIVSGFAPKETTVKIFVNGDETTKVLADKDGKFTSRDVTIKEGSNTIFATITEKTVESSPSASYMVVYKKGEPKLEIESPKDGEMFRDDQKEITISGTTDEDNRVVINDRLAIVDTQGRFSYRVQLSDGENKFKISSSDQAGNTVEKEIKVTYSP